MNISIISFSFKRGLPEDSAGNGGGFVFDCRAMPNPFWDEALRGYSGCDKPVVDFFEQYKDKVDCFLMLLKLWFVNQLVSIKKMAENICRWHLVALGGSIGLYTSPNAWLSGLRVLMA